MKKTVKLIIVSLVIFSQTTLFAGDGGLAFEGPPINVDKLYSMGMERWAQTADRRFAEFTGRGTPEMSSFDALSILNSEPARPDFYWSKGNGLSFIIPTESTPRLAFHFIHGLTDTSYYGYSMAQFFHRRGVPTVAGDLPGHGLADPQALRDVTRFEWYQQSNEDRQVAERLVGGSGKIVLGGFSTGATIQLKYALEEVLHGRGNNIAGLYMFSPAIDLDYRRVKAAAAWSADKIRVKSLFPNPNKHPLVENRVRYNQFPPNGVLQLSRVIQDLNQIRAKQISVPFPIFAAFSLNDRVISVDAILNFFKDINAPRKVATVYVAPSKLKYILSRRVDLEAAGVELHVMNISTEGQRIKHSQVPLKKNGFLPEQSNWLFEPMRTHLDRFASETLGIHRQSPRSSVRLAGGMCSHFL